MADRSTKEKVWSLLDDNPLLKPKLLCKLLNLKYDDYRQYVTNLRSKWKKSPKNEQGSKCSVHGWRGWCVVPRGLDRARAVEAGWRRTRSRNRWLLWKDRLGRLMWFETGRVNLFVRKPANLGRAFQLVCCGFSWTGLITDLRVLDRVLSTIRFKGAHYVFETGQRLPRLTVDLFGSSNGVVIKVGDRSHPTSLEVIATYPDWAERNERLFEHTSRLLEKVAGLLMPQQANSEREVDYVS